MSLKSNLVVANECLSILKYKPPPQNPSRIRAIDDRIIAVDNAKEIPSFIIEAAVTVQ